MTIQGIYNTLTALAIALCVFRLIILSDRIDTIKDVLKETRTELAELRKSVESRKE